MSWLQVTGLQVTPEKLSGNILLVVNSLALSQVCGSEAQQASNRPVAAAVEGGARFALAIFAGYVLPYAIFELGRTP